MTVRDLVRELTWVVDREREICAELGRRRASPVLAPTSSGVEAGWQAEVDEVRGKEGDDLADATLVPREQRRH